MRRHWPPPPAELKKEDWELSLPPSVEMAAPRASVDDTKKTYYPQVQTVGRRSLWFLVRTHGPEWARGAGLSATVLLSDARMIHTTCGIAAVFGPTCDRSKEWVEDVIWNGGLVVPLFAG